MTPPAATAAARALPRHQPRPRRVPSPAGPRRTGAEQLRPLGARVASRAAALPDARVLDRLIRGRAWIALIGVMLMGLVFLQVSLLQLNTGIGRSVQTEANLERANQELRNANASLSGNERVQDVAQRLGMVMPAAGQVRYLRAGSASAASAARLLSAPAPVTQQPAPQTAELLSAPVAGPAPVAQPAPATQTAPVAQPAPVAQAAPVAQPAQAQTAPVVQQAVVTTTGGVQPAP